MERFSVDGEGDAKPEHTRALVDRADVIFLGGGDPVLAVERLRIAGADAWIRDARERGAVCVGLSAGSIALGAFWASWPDDDPDGEPALVRCLGVAPRLVVDCHAEEDDWEELRAVRRQLELSGLLVSDTTFAGIRHGSALVVHPDDRLEWMGKPTLI